MEDAHGQAAPDGATAEESARPAARKQAPARPAGAGRKKAGDTRSRHVGEKRQRANDALRLELHALRGALATIIEGYEVRVGGRINDLLRTMEGDSSIDQPPRLLPTAEAQAALDDIAGVRLRPDKPRLRDLRRIQRLVRRLRARIPE